MYEYITGRVESLTPASAVVEAGWSGVLPEYFDSDLFPDRIPDGGETLYAFCRSGGCPDTVRIL